MFERFRNILPVSDEKWAAYIDCFTRIEAPPKTVLLSEGEISHRLFVVEKGCVRAWFNNDGKDLTFQFFFEDGVVSSIESFRKSIPSPVTLETIEKSVLWYIEKKDLEGILAVLNEIPAFRNLFIDAIFERTFDYMKHFFSFIKESPTERYQSLIKEYPQSVQRVPQHYIASFLGVSTVHLSRIKNALARKK